MNVPLGLYTHPDCLLHDAGPGNPERPQRLQALTAHLKRTGIWQDLQVLKAQPASAADLERVHTREYLDRVESQFAAGENFVDSADANGNRETFAATRLASGAALDAAEQILAGTLQRAFVMLRPPGHHAEVDRAMGFCFSNHVALAARSAIQQHGLERVAIVDFDVHHGNGTQHIFERDPSVFYASLHQSPHYPGTGAREERGLGDGEGTTLNCPMPAGSGDGAWQAALEETVLPALDKFEPQLLLISAGFDAHQRDPLSETLLTSEAFGRMTRSLLDLAKQHAKGRVVSILEGGYDLEGLSEGVAAHLGELTA
jgi:acetoin utilization deacetylase AcuC-like enzyme